MPRIVRRAGHLNKYRNRRISSAYTMTIQGKVVNIFQASVVYRCGTCGDKLDQVDSTVKCKTNRKHRDFVHRDELEKMRSLQQENIKALKETYIIEDGIVKLVKLKST